MTTSPGCTECTADGTPLAFVGSVGFSIEESVNQLTWNFAADGTFTQARFSCAKITAPAGPITITGLGVAVSGAAAASRTWTMLWGSAPLFASACAGLAGSYSVDAAAPDGIWRVPGAPWLELAGGASVYVCVGSYSGPGVLASPGGESGQLYSGSSLFDVYTAARVDYSGTAPASCADLVPHSSSLAKFAGVFDYKVPLELVSFVLTTASVSEAAGSVAIQVTRTSTGTTPEFGVASDGKIAASTVSFPGLGAPTLFGVSSTSASPAVTIVDNNIPEADRVTVLRLVTTPAGLACTSPQTRFMTLTLTDDDPTTVALQFATATISEPAASLYVSLTRTGALGGTFAVKIKYTPGSAKGSGVDYSEVFVKEVPEGVGSFGVVIPMRDDAIPEDVETFTMALESVIYSGTATGNVVLGTTQTVVSIHDNDPMVITDVRPAAQSPSFNSLVTILGAGFRTTAPCIYIFFCIFFLIFYF